MQFKPVQCLVECTTNLKRKHSRWLPRMHSISPVVENKMPNAIIATGMVIFIGNVLLHHDPPREVVDRIMVIGTQEDVKEVVEEDTGVVEEDHSSQ